MRRVALGLVLVLLLGLLVFEAQRQLGKSYSSRSNESTAAQRQRTEADLTKASGGLANENAASPSGVREDWFHDATAELGISFNQSIGPYGTYYMPEINGSGGTLIDYDGDGDLDLFLMDLGHSPKADPWPEGRNSSHRMFRREADGKYSDQTVALGLDRVGPATKPVLGNGCTVGDVNNDGFPDLYLTNVGADELLINDAGKGFHVEDGTGLGCEDWGTAAAFFDYDRDGRLDLFVVNYARDDEYGLSIACASHQGRLSYCGPHKFTATVDRLFHNEGIVDGKIRFRDVSVSSGVASAPTYGLGIAIADFTSDGYPDVFVANDMGPNRLWINRQDGTFSEEAQSRGVAVNGDGSIQGCMGVAVGDPDNDGDLDLVITNLVTEGAVLYVNDGGGNFRDQSRRTELMQLTQRHTGWGIGLVDIDLDGRLDMPLVNGFVVPNGSMFPPHGEDKFAPAHEQITDNEAFIAQYYDVNQLLLGKENGGFRDGIRMGSDFVQTNASTRGLIPGDIDGDGDIDLITTCVGGQAKVYVNQARRRGHWLALDCRTGPMSRTAVGAMMELRVGERRQAAVVASACSFLAGDPGLVHFGLGQTTGHAEVRVSWPDGRREQFALNELDKMHHLVQGNGKPIPELEQ
ncbi:MAG: CRTAC1 family protein [Pirellulales bacterium]